MSMWCATLYTSRLGSTARPGACVPPLSWPRTAADQGSLKVIQYLTLQGRGGRGAFHTILMSHKGSAGCAGVP